MITPARIRMLLYPGDCVCKIKQRAQVPSSKGVVNDKEAEERNRKRKKGLKKKVS